MHTGHDAVRFFLRDFKGVRGDGFVLPDVGQIYRYVDRHDHYKEGSERVADMLHFEAECAVAGCEATFRIGRTEAAMRRNPRCRRTCAAHKGQYRTEMRGLWIPAAKLVTRAPGVERVREGTTRKAIREALAAFDLVGTPTARQVIAVAAGLMPSGSVSERRRSAKRALRLMVAQGALGSDAVIW